VNTDHAWELWGARDPYYGVLTHPQYRAAVLTPEAKEEFFAMGRWHADRVLSTCRRHLDANFAPRRILDFGCGVGRLVIPFAAIAEAVVGVDISPSMLAEARSNCEERGLRNVSFVPSDDQLSAVEGGFDLVHSSIVLQHIDVQRGRGLFKQLVDRVNPGGCGALHVTFAWDVHAANFGHPPPPVLPPPPSGLARFKQGIRRWLPRRAQPEEAVADAPDPASLDPEMQMHYYNLSELMFIAQRAGIHHVVTELTDHGGALGAFLFFQAPALALSSCSNEGSEAQTLPLPIQRHE
jgi:SAM-dependent methyltransferase